jgi:hypothetical protein
MSTSQSSSLQKEEQSPDTKRDILKGSGKQSDIGVDGAVVAIDIGVPGALILPIGLSGGEPEGKADASRVGAPAFHITLILPTLFE